MTSSENRGKEILNEMEISLKKAVQEYVPIPGSLKKVIEDMQSFLTEKPDPPQEWKARLGDKSHLYDYHQICIPEDLNDPNKSELENLSRLSKTYGDSGFLALEYFLVTRNHFLYDAQHCSPVLLESPLLMLESMEENSEVDWDCFFYLFPDGSFYSYALEKDQEEILALDGSEEMKIHSELLAHLQIRFPIEGEDYGWIGKQNSK